MEDIEGEEVEELIGKGSATFIYMNIDILPNYDQDKIRECASDPGANTFNEWWAETQGAIEDCGTEGYDGSVWCNSPYSTIKQILMSHIEYSKIKKKKCHD